MNIMTSNNLYRITSESNMDEIMSDNTDKLCIVMFGTKTCPPCRIIKPHFIKLSQEATNCMFLYVNLNDYEDYTYKYTNDIHETPMFIYYYNGFFRRSCTVRCFIYTYYYKQQTV